MIDPFAKQKARQILEHVHEWITDLTSAGRDDAYIYRIDKRIRRLIAECGWTRLTDVDANSFIQWRDTERANLRQGDGRDGKAPAPRTLNHWLDAARAFMNWCASTKRIEGVPTGGGKLLSPALGTIVKVDGPAKRKRRALSDDQVTQLLGVAPADRKLIYRLALASGLRRQELADLR